MHFDPTATHGELHAFLNRTIQSCGWKTWKRRFDALGELGGNPLLKQFYEYRYPLEFEILSLVRHHRATGRYPDIETLSEHEARSFLAMYARVHQRLSPPGQKRLSGMLRSCLDTNAQYGLRPLQHEMTVATHLMTHGFDVQFTDIEGTARFDFLATKDGAELEIECKTFGGDIGRRIHMRAFYALGGVLFDQLSKMLRRDPGGHFVKITVPNRLHVRSEFLQSIKHALSSVIDSRSKQLTTLNCNIELDSFDIRQAFGTIDVTAGLPNEDLRKLVEGHFGCINRNALALVSPPNSMAILVVDCPETDDVVPSMRKALKQASQQCSGQRSAVICVRLTDLTEQQLRSLAAGGPERKPTGLEYMAHYLFKNTDRSHIHSVAFMAGGELKRERILENHSVKEGLGQFGGAWVFSNNQAKTAKDPRYQAFL